MKGSHESPQEKPALSLRLGLILVLLLVALDQGIKYLSPLKLANRGIAFALFPGSGLLLSLTGGALLVGLTWHLRRELPLRLPLVLLWAGMASNLLDRMTKGAVIDIVYLGPLSVNFADLLLIAGAAMAFTRAIRRPPTTRI